MKKIIVFLIVAVFFFAVAVPIVGAAQQDTADRALALIGTDTAGFYSWAINQITAGFRTIDTELQGIGEASDLAGLFTDNLNDTLEQFDGITTEAQAFDKLNEILEGTK